MGDRFAARFLLPGGLWLLAFFAVPLGIVLAISFGTTGDLGGAVYGWYPENYSHAFNPLFAPVLLRSVGYALATVVLCLVLGYPVAYYIARFGGRRKNLLIALVVLPFFVNYLVRTYAWVALLSDEGIVNGLLNDAGIRNDPISFLNTSWAVIGGLVYGYLAFMILPVYAALERVPGSLIEASRDLGAKGGTTFRTVVLPLALPGIVAGSIFTFSLTLGDFITPTIVGGDNHQLIGSVVYSNFGIANNAPFAAAFATVPLAIMAIYLVTARRLGAFEHL